MLSTDTWLKLICAMMTNAVIFGFGIVPVLAVPVLSAHSAYLIPGVVVMSFLISPFVAAWIAPRMRRRNWGDRWQTGDIISG